MRHSSRFSAPKNITWWIALILAVLGIIFHFVSVQPLSQFSFWMVAVSAVLLLIATRFKGI
jgi:asparagine N-glycosylation enzyme membrane subunit Stt3